MKNDAIIINKSMIPYSFDILLADELFNLLISYNNNADLFTVTLSRNGEIVCIEPIIYGIPLFKDVFQPAVYPAVDIVPFDESGRSVRVTFDNLSETVHLVIDNGGDKIE